MHRTPESEDRLSLDTCSSDVSTPRYSQESTLQQNHVSTPQHHHVSEPQLSHVSVLQLDHNMSTPQHNHVPIPQQNHAPVSQQNHMSLPQQNQMFKPHMIQVSTPQLNHVSDSVQNDILTHHPSRVSSPEHSRPPYHIHAHDGTTSLGRVGSGPSAVLYPNLLPIEQVEEKHGRDNRLLRNPHFKPTLAPGSLLHLQNGAVVHLVQDYQHNKVAPFILPTIRSSAQSSILPSVDTHSLNGSLLPSILKSSFGDHDGGIGSSRADLVTEESEGAEPGEGGQCGWLCLRPHVLQHTRTAKWVLFWLCCAAAAQGMVVNGFVNVCITSIEKRFDLRSTDTGLIAGAYDMASVLCSVPVSYLGSRPGSSKPRWLGWGIFIMGVGSFVFTLPHFISPTYNPSSTTNSDFVSVLLCLRKDSRDSQCTVLVENWLSSFRHIFVMGQFLHGVGASPLYTLGITYLDESVSVKMSSMYLGIFYAMAVVGPAAGYVLGGQFLKAYIDSPNISPDTFGVEPASDLWLGAWWIGFLLSGTVSVLLSWPIMAFPGQLPGAKAIKASRVSEAYGAGETIHGGGGGFGRLRDLPQAARVLAFNPTFIALSLAGATEGILLAGFATFTPKFLENQFSMPASRAALIVGFVAVPAGGGGTMLGGWIIKRLNLSCSGILKMCIIFSAICVLSCLTFVISCPNIHFAGVNVDYMNRSVIPTLPNLTSTCNQDCKCQDLPYDPICGTNNVMYFSPCHAGCTGMERGSDGVKVFTGCECVSPHSTSQIPGLEVGDPRLAPDSALREKCPPTCFLMPIFLAIFFVVMLLTFIISLPAVSGTLRCVPDTHRSFALGLQWIVVRLLGTIPGPILFGALFDHTCTLWQSTCGRDGACRSYDNFYMSRYMMGTSVLFKFLSTILFFLAWWLYVAPPAPPDPSPSSPATAASTAVDSATIPDPNHTSSSVKSSKGKRELRGIDNPGVDLL